MFPVSMCDSVWDGCMRGVLVSICTFMQERGSRTLASITWKEPPWTPNKAFEGRFEHFIVTHCRTQVGLQCSKVWEPLIYRVAAYGILHSFLATSSQKEYTSEHWEMGKIVPKGSDEEHLLQMEQLKHLRPF